MTRTCPRPGCGAPVTKRQRQYCSAVCANAHRRKPRRVCARAGCDQPCRITAHRYCSQWCAAIARCKPMPRCKRPGCTCLVKDHDHSYCSPGCALAVRKVAWAERRRRRSRPCANFECLNRVVEVGRHYCSRDCSASARRVQKRQCARQGCQRQVGHHGKRFCSAACSAADQRGRHKTLVPRTNVCDSCGKTFTRRYPSLAAKVQTCSRKCQGDLQRRRFAERRPAHVRQRFGVLTKRESELYAMAYKAGYQRGRFSVLRRLPPAREVA